MKKLIIWALAAFALAACGDTKESNEVFITPYGERYHHNWCRTIQGHSITSLSLESAERRGRTPCRVCYQFRMIKDENINGAPCSYNEKGGHTLYIW